MYSKCLSLKRLRINCLIFATPFPYQLPVFLYTSPTVLTTLHPFPRLRGVFGQATVWQIHGRIGTLSYRNLGWTYQSLGRKVVVSHIFAWKLCMTKYPFSIFFNRKYIFIHGGFSSQSFVRHMFFVGHLDFSGSSVTLRQQNPPKMPFRFMNYGLPESNMFTPWKLVVGRRSFPFGKTHFQGRKY